MCAGDCQFFPSAPLLSRSESQKTAYIYHMWTLHIVSIYFSLLFITYQYSQKNSLYIWTSHTFFIYLSYILIAHLSPCPESQKKQPIYNIYGRHILSSYIFHIFLHLKITKTAYIYIFGHHILSQYIYFAHFISFTYKYSHFPPFLVQRHKKTTYIDVTYFLIMFFTFFFYHILIFPPYSFSCTKDSPFMEDTYFFILHIFFYHMYQNSHLPFDLVQSQRRRSRVSGVLKNSQCVVHIMPK